MKISYVNNDIYNKTNTAYSLWLALKDLNEDIFIIEGDVFFSKDVFTNFLKEDNATVVEKYNPSLDGSFVDVKENIVVDWIHKKDRYPGFTIEDKYKTVNIHKFDKDFLNKYLLPFIEENIENIKEKEPIEYIMKRIIRNGAKIKAVEANAKWFEIDDENDLKIAERIFMDLNDIKSRHGGYWRYPLLDFYYLFNHYFPPKELIEKLQKDIPILIDNYPSTQRIIAQLVSKWKDKDYFNENNLVIVNGSSELIKILSNIITKATMHIPIFNEYIHIKDRANFVYLKEEENFEFDVKELIKAVKDSNSEYLIINNPNNPVGNIMSKEEIEEILKTGVKLIIDEAFIDFAPEYSCEDLITKYDNLIIVKSLTKIAGVAGLRIGYLLTTNEEIKKKVKELLPIWNINSVAERFIELFGEYKKDYKDSIQKMINDREDMFNKLKKISYLKLFKSYANFIFCKTSISSRKLAEHLLEKHRILIKYGLKQLNLNSDNYVRFGIRGKKENDKLINVLKEFENENK